jgi:hypothetical protein
MKNKAIVREILAAALVFALNLTGCNMTADSNGRTKGSAITLFENTWANGSITSFDGEQWFKFTATAGMHYLHVSFGTLTNLYIQVYDNNNNLVGESTSFGGSGSGSTYLTIVVGKVYFIRVTPYSGGAGTYLIAFNTTPSPPLPPGAFTTAETLVEDKWTHGIITSSNNEQSFKFTATASTQYLHVSFGTLTDLYVQFYNSSGSMVGSRKFNSRENKTYDSLPVTEGQMYYIKVTPDSGSGTYGTYWITFNTSSTPPED